MNDETQPVDGDDYTWEEPAAPTLEERLAQVERTLEELAAKVATWEGDS